jgi:hypothetical protein
MHSISTSFVNNYYTYPIKYLNKKKPLKTEVAWRNRNTNENSQNNASRWPAKEINMPEDTDTDISQHTPYQGFSVTGYIVCK